MIKKNNIAIIPARSKSKGLINKNIKRINNTPLIGYSIKAAIESNLFDEVMVSTDSIEYAKIAKSYGANVPFLRSDENSADHSSSWDAVKEVLENYKKNGIEFKNVFLLQPTSPLRDSQDIIDAFDVFNQKKAKYVISVSETDHSPLWCNTIPSDLSLSNFINEKISDCPRQSLPKYYRINGAIYIIDCKHLLSNDESKLMKENCYAFIMSKNKSIDIDDELDFIIASAIINMKIKENIEKN